jgi:uncharacterized protein (TIGR02453 family)
MNDGADLKPVLEFLKGLQKNNNKLWFDDNRPVYERAKARFEDFIDEVIIGLGSVEDLRGITARDCVYRIYSDVRFSKDRSPYKMNMGASIGPGGKRSWRLSYYMHLEPHGASMVAGGLHAPDSSQLVKFREAIDRDSKPFKKVVDHKAFKKTFGEVSGEKLKTVPKGYDRDHPDIELLRMKEVVAVKGFPDALVLSPSFSAQVVEAFTAMKPFLDYLNSVIH